MKDSEKHQESEKSKKKQIQTLLLNALKILINQQKQTEQNEKNDSEKVFIKKNKNWYEIIIHEIKILQIKEIDNLMTCKWLHWITCYNDEYEKY